MRSMGSLLPCREGTETGVLDFRGILAVREWPLLSGFCEAEVGLAGPADGEGLATGLSVEVTVTILVAILRGAFLAFMAENDKGRPSVGRDPMLKERAAEKNDAAQIAQGKNVL
jgi:hypothetical protein